MHNYAAALQVFESMAALTQQGKTVIYVTHDQQLAGLATARIDLLDGQIAGQSNADAIVTVERIPTGALHMTTGGLRKTRFRCISVHLRANRLPT